MHCVISDCVIIAAHFTLLFSHSTIQPQIRNKLTVQETLMTVPMTRHCCRYHYYCFCSLSRLFCNLPQISWGLKRLSH